MKSVFEPSNALEGYMLQDLLKQRGIAAHVQGAQLQGGVGELPASGLVRVVVEDADFSAAREVIEDWESANVPNHIPVPAPDHGATKWFVAGLVGLAIGIVGTYAFLRAPTQLDTVDNNEDGRWDEYLHFSPLDVLLESEVDRNYDGKFDLVSQFDRMRRVESVKGDEDFNGSFETHWYYRANQVYFATIDSDGDSTIDLKTYFESGVAVSAEYFVHSASHPVRIEYFSLGKLKSAEVDTDRDGRLDKRYRYSDLAEIVGTESIEAARPSD